MEIRTERRGDEEAVSRLVTAAFREAEHSDGREAAIVETLRESGALAISLVALVDGAIVGHVAFSPVTVEGRHDGWFGLGPVAVRPGRQRRGIGRALIQQGLIRLRESRARGCVVVGDPAFYASFGFGADPGLHVTGVPPEYFLSLPFGDETPGGMVEYHPAFGGA